MRSPAWAATAAWILLVPVNGSAADAPCFPPRGSWSSMSPESAGFDAARLQAAVEFAVAQETPQPRDLALAIALDFAREPHDAIIGPTAPRGAPTGLVIRHGHVVARWGEPDRVDMAFSVTKSFLSTVVGLAGARGLLDSLDEPVAARVKIPEFAGEPNAEITWNQLLRQTSGWRGTLWDKPDWADRPTGDDRYAWPTLPVPAPGAAFEYNDVRVNALALAALHLWREPLPAVLAREVMEPIGASDRWRWHGYANSWVEIGGRRVQSVSGGGHWGGGMFIDAWDLARFGLLWLNRGRWGDRQVVPEAWVDYASTPTPQNPEYGAMNWFLNHDRGLLPSAPPQAVVHLGNGTNAVYVDPVNDLVVVVRWIRRDQLDAFIGRVLESLAP
jgi:CubicO group peptidase (beta-lactamase class C family)